MVDRFRAFARPDAALLEALCMLDPANPFSTPAFVGYRSAASGTIPWALTFERDGQLHSGCIAYLQPSRLPWSNRLEIHSLAVPNGTGVETFWDGLWALCHRERVSRLTLLSFGSQPSTGLPDRPGRLWHRPRCEYLLNLVDFRGMKSLSSNHRRNLNRAEREGIRLVESREAGAAAIHASLMGLSLNRRRSRGEVVGGGSAGDPTRRLLASGAARIFQSAQDGTVMSSILVLQARNGAYYHSAGTSPEGMKAGASHLLLTRLAEQLRAEGLDVFNLGGTDSEGLARFKAGFGAEPVALEAAAWFTGNRVSILLDTLVNPLRRLRR